MKANNRGQTLESTLKILPESGILDISRDWPNHKLLPCGPSWVWSWAAGLEPVLPFAVLVRHRHQRVVRHLVQAWLRLHAASIGSRRRSSYGLDALPVGQQQVITPGVLFRGEQVGRNIPGLRLWHLLQGKSHSIHFGKSLSLLPDGGTPGVFAPPSLHWSSEQPAEVNIEIAILKMVKLPGTRKASLGSFPSSDHSLARCLRSKENDFQWFTCQNSCLFGSHL